MSGGCNSGRRYKVEKQVEQLDKLCETVIEEDEYLAVLELIDDSPNR